MFAIRDSDKLRSCLLFDIGYVYLKPNYYSKSYSYVCISYIEKRIIEVGV